MGLRLMPTGLEPFLSQSDQDGGASLLGKMKLRVKIKSMMPEGSYFIFIHVVQKL